LPRVIDYSSVLDTLTRAGFESLYHNSGAFGFARGVATQSVGWVGPADPTLRPDARSLTRQVPAPHAENMAALATRFRREHLPGPLWLMPKSHWAYELDYGNGDWLPAVLEQIAIAPATLAGRNDASAVEFDANEAAAFGRTLQELLTQLHGSDFALAWPSHPLTCTVHHHGQLWWTSTDPALVVALTSLTPT